MNTTVNALKNLYEAAGGEEATVENVNLIPDMIDALADIATPFIQEADEGKVVQNGALVVQTSKNITENGTHDTTTNNEVVVNVAGNPNYIETITGTLANPWGSIDPDELCIDIASKDASCMITIDLTSMGFGPVTLSVQAFPAAHQIVASVAQFSGTDINNCIAMRVTFGTEATHINYDFYTLFNGSINNYTGIADTIPTTITIVHHPLPTT